MRRSLWILVFGLSALGQAKLLDPIGTAPTRTFDESGLKITIPTEVKPTAGGVPKLFLTGAGVRKKKVALFKVNVYVAAHYSDRDPKGKVQALEMTFLRDLSAEQVRNAFQESLKANGANPDAGALKTTLAKLDMPMPKGTSLTLLGVKNAGKETLTIETPKGSTVTGEGPALVTDFWNIWFGKTVDSCLEDLKAELKGSRT